MSEPSVSESLAASPLDTDEALALDPAQAVLEAPVAEQARAQVPRWYAVQVASSCEKKVKATLEQRAVTLGVHNRIFEIEIPQTPGVKLKKVPITSGCQEDQTLFHIQVEFPHCFPVML